MVVLPLSQLPNDYDLEPSPEKAEPMKWVRYAAAGSLVASGALMLSGKRRAAIVAAATGTVLAMLDQQDVLRKWWTTLPNYIGDVQRLLGNIEVTVDEFAAQRDRLGKLMGRNGF